MLRASAQHPTDQRLFESKLEDMVDTIHHADLSGLGGAAVEEVQSFDKAPLDDIVNMTFPVDPRDQRTRSRPKSNRRLRPCPWW